MSAKFSIAETENFTEKIDKRDFASVYYKIENYVYPQLKLNPYYGHNIKKLKGKFKDMYRYRVANFRLFYTIDEEQVLVLMIDIEKRKDAYRKR